MTMPHLENCQHTGDGWCFECVGNMGRELIAARATIAELERDADFLRAQVVDGTREIERLREMLRDHGRECGFCQCD